MPEFELIHRSALAARPITSDRIRVTPLPEGTVLQVLGPSSELASLKAVAQAADLAIRANGPDQWFLVGDGPAPARDLLPAFSLIDQSHGRVRIAVEGVVVEDVLAKGTGLDLASFEIGAATTTMIGHIATHMTRVSADRFELMVLRGFAESLWHDLEAMSAEFR